MGGHYLTAMAINAATGNDECRKRMEYMISELQECADANVRNHPTWGKGYVGGMPGSDKLWSTFKQGNFSTYFGSWAPFYNLMLELLAFASCILKQGIINGHNGTTRITEYRVYTFINKCPHQSL